MDLDKFDNFRQGIADTLNDAYDESTAKRYVGYAEGRDYAKSAEFVNDSDADADAFDSYFPADA
jgi:hypothetical protein